MQRLKYWTTTCSLLCLVGTITWTGGADRLSAAGKGYYIFSRERITHSSSSRLTIGIGERLPIKGLKQRFPGFAVRATAGEDCLYCATVGGKAGSFDVNYDETGAIITSIYSYDPGSTDAIGNTVGSSLRAVLGETGECDAGLMTTCKSKSIGSLSYIVEDNEKCEMKIPDKGNALIPRCARVSGFILHDDRK